MSSNVRIIDIHYNEVTTVPDGKVIRVKYLDGHVVEDSVRYVDPTHFWFGKSLYHIHQFAEWLHESKARVVVAMQLAVMWQDMVTGELTVTSEWVETIDEIHAIVLERGKIALSIVKIN